MSARIQTADRSKRARHRGARLWCLLGILAAFAAAEARAHNLGDSYLYLQIYEDTITGRFEIALSDLNPALGLSGTDLEITPENLDARIGFLQQYYREHITIADAGGPLSIDFTGHSLLGGARGGYVLLPFELGGLDGVPDRLTFDYSILFDDEPSHRGFLLIEHNWATGTFANENRVSLAFTSSSRRQEFDLTSSGRLRGFLALARLGAEHMLLGTDHVMFLLALLLPAVLRREDGTWRAVDRFAAALGNAAVIVTAFLVAHGVAVGLMALAGVRLPEPLVETVIAASSVLAAVNILRPLFPRPPSPGSVFQGRVWWIVFALSLFHGFGFAAGLLDLGVLDEHLGLSLLAFNLGVEAGQIAIVAALLPLLFLIRRLTLYRKAVLPMAAIAVILVSGIWVIERALDVDVPIRELLPSAVQKVIP